LPRRNFISHLVLCLVLLAACRAVCETAGPSANPANPIVLADIEMWKGHHYLEAGRADLATDAFRKASELDKSSPYPHLALARVCARRSLMDAFLEFGAGLKLASNNFPYQSLLVANVVIIIFVAAGVAIYIGVLIVLARHAKTVWFSLLLTYSPLFGDLWLRLLIIAAIGAFLVMLAGSSPVAMVTWAAVVGCGFAWRFANAAERRMMVALVAFLAVFTPAFDLTTRIVSTQHPDSPARIAALDRYSFEPGMTRLAAAQGPLSEKNPVGQFMRGLISLKNGQNGLAADYFSRITKLGGSDVAVLNNLGVAYHNLGRFREAQAAFEKASKEGPKEAVIHYNYSQTLNALLQYDRAQAELTKASALDFDLTRAMVTSKDKPTLIPMGLSAGVLWDMAMSSRDKAVVSAYNPIESGWEGMLVLLGLAGGAFALMRKSRLPARCDICEKIVRTQVAKRKRRDILCPECRAIKQVNADDNDALEKQVEERVSRLERLRNIGSLLVGVLPGGTYYLLGSKAKGFLYAFATLVFAAVALSGGGPIRQTPKLESGASVLWALVCLIVVYGISLWRSAVLVLGAAEED
jgi:Tfp pilus assembly protein PilF